MLNHQVTWRETHPVTVFCFLLSFIANLVRIEALRRSLADFCLGHFFEIRSFCSLVLSSLYRLLLHNVSSALRHPYLKMHEPSMNFLAFDPSWSCCLMISNSLKSYDLNSGHTQSSTVSGLILNTQKSKLLSYTKSFVWSESNETELSFKY